MTLIHILTIVIFLGCGVMGTMAVLGALAKLKTAIYPHMASGFAPSSYQRNALHHVSKIN